MISEFVFIDKTLAYALKNEKIDLPDYMLLMKKVTAITKMYFDIHINSLLDYSGGNSLETDFGSIRASVDWREEQVLAAYEMGITWIKININHIISDEAVNELVKVLTLAARLKMKITLGCMDITENIEEFQNEKLLNILNSFEISGLIVHDGESRLDPVSTYEKLLEIKNALPVKLEYGGKNGFGLATGNTLGAVKSGVAAMAVSIGGIGGFPAYEEVVMGINRLLKMPVDIPQNIAVCCKELLEYIRIEIPKTKPIIGANIFAHESGIHVDGIFKRSELYEPFAPEEVGLSRKIVIGKHSGKAAIEHKIQELNINVRPCCIKTLLEKVRSLAIKQKTAVGDEQLLRLIEEVAVCNG